MCGLLHSQLSHRAQGAHPVALNAARRLILRVRSSETVAAVWERRALQPRARP